VRRHECGYAAQHQGPGRGRGQLGRISYAECHGSEDGWDAIVAAAATQVALPADFNVTRHG